MTRAALALIPLSLSAAAHAEGERTPMIGVTALGADAVLAPEHEYQLAGAGLDAAWWYGRVGIGAEGSALWSFDGDNAHAFVLGVSARVRVLETISPALMDPRPVEDALELQVIAEHTWWSVPGITADPTSYGFGVALRVRGGCEPLGSTLLAESRYFLRVMTSRPSELDTIVRSAMPPASSDRAYLVMFGIGASFGDGTAAYLERFRPQPFGSLFD